MSTTPENLIADAIIRYLATCDKQTATMSQIRHNLPKFIDLTEEDRRPSRSRPGEQMWEQIVRNVVCHRKVPDNAIHDGTIVYVSRGRLALSGFD